MSDREWIVILATVIAGILAYNWIPETTIGAMIIAFAAVGTVILPDKEDTKGKTKGDT